MQENVKHDGIIVITKRCFSAGLDFNNLYEMSEVLIQAGLPTDAVFTIREHFDTTPGAKSLAEVSIFNMRKINNASYSVTLC